MNLNRATAEKRVQRGRPSPTRQPAAYHRWRRACLYLGLPTHHEWRLSRIERAYFRERRLARGQGRKE